MRICLGKSDIDLRATLMDSAQCFHWIERDNRFGAVLRGEAVWLWKEGDALYARGGDAAYLREYLDLDRDYAAVLKAYDIYPQCAAAIDAFRGLHVLNQPAWEALAAFILSANNNVPRIRNLVLAVNRAYGAEADGMYGFPPPQALAEAGEEALRALRMGYRAGYLARTARMVADGFPLDTLRTMPYAEARAKLTGLRGVGDKVADCVLLFGCGHAEAFPVDVWVERLMGAWFGVHETNRRRVGEKAMLLLGEHAGILQQYLFHAARTGRISL